MSKEKVIVLLSLITIAFVAYRNCFGIFIPSDNFSELFFYAKHGVGGIKQNLNNGALYVFFFPIIYFLYSLFGTESYCWMVASVLLHSAIAFLIFLIVAELTTSSFSKHSIYLGIFSSLLFLLSPYQTESVIWTPTCLAILLSSFWTLLSLYLLIKYLSTPKKTYFSFLLISFFLAVFSYECSFFFPFAAIVLFAYMRMTKGTNVKIKTAIIKLFLPLSSFVFSYFLICKLFFDRWIIHGGEAMDLQADPIFLSGNLLKYFAKFFIMYRYWDFPQLKEWILENHKNLLFISVVLFLSASLLFITITKSIKKQKASGYLLLAIFLCFLFSLVPVLPLDTSFLRIIYSDRYGYLPSAFFYIFSAIGIYLLFRKLAFLVLPTIAIIFWLLLNNTITVWNETNQYCYALLSKFEPFMNQDNIYILNLPSYYNGIAAFRVGFVESIYFKYHKEVAEKNITIVSHGYMKKSIDSLIVSRENAMTFAVSVPKRRDPYFGSGPGWAQSYSNNNFAVDYDSARCAYLLSFRDSVPKNAVMLYVSGTEWKKTN